MKFFCILLLLSVSQALDINNAQGYELEVQRDGTRSIGAPNDITIILSGPPLTLQVIWVPVPSPPTNPIRGYMTKLWIQQTRIVQSQELVDGEYVTVEREEPIPMPDGLPDWDPLEVVKSAGSANNIADFRTLLVEDRWYEVRIQAYTLTDVGPYSRWIRFRLTSVA